MEKTCSLKKNESFLRVYRKGVRVHHRYFVLHACPNGLDRNRLGIKVGKKIAGAVGRNRIKRLVREAYRLSGGKPSCFCDFVIVAKEGAEKITGLGEVSDALTLLLGRLKVGRGK